MDAGVKDVLRFFGKCRIDIIQLVPSLVSSACYILYISSLPYLQRLPNTHLFNEMLQFFSASSVIGVYLTSLSLITSRCLLSELSCTSSVNKLILPEGLYKFYPVTIAGLHNNAP